MKIDHLEIGHYNIPLAKVLTDSTHGEMRHVGVVTVRVRADNGTEGLGYTYTVGKTGADAVRSHLESDLAPVLVGQDPRRVEFLWQRMWRTLHFVGRGGVSAFAMAAADVALWDLKAKLAGEPLWRLLGGNDPEVRVYAGGIDLEMPLDELQQQTRDNLDRGFRAIKMKVGRPRLDEDVERVRAIRDLLGPEIPLMVDANMCWRPDEAILAARAFREFGVFWLEEPTNPDDFEGQARIGRDGGVPIAAGENLHTVYEFQKAIAAGGVDFPEPDLATCGGITPWMKVARLAEANNLPVTSHGVQHLHVHVLAAVPNASFLEAHGFGLEKYMTRSMEITEGVTVAPDDPGHGIDFDWEALEAVRA